VGEGRTQEAARQTQSGRKERVIKKREREEEREFPWHLNG